MTVRTNAVDNDSFNPMARTLNWDSNSGLLTSNGGVQTPALGLGHELAHAAAPPGLVMRLQLVPAGAYGNLEEFRVINFWEAGAAAHLGEPARLDHLGTPIRTQGPTVTY
jgi:hypothetical protein